MFSFSVQMQHCAVKIAQSNFIVKHENWSLSFDRNSMSQKVSSIRAFHFEAKLITILRSNSYDRRI